MIRIVKQGNVVREVFRKLTRPFRKHGGGLARRHLLDRMPKGGVCAEIGVWKGEFSESILRVTNPRRLHLVDPWAFQSEFPDRAYGGSVAKGQADMDRMYEAVRSRFAPYPEVELSRGKSEHVLPGFADGYFDWVYIDGNHCYEFVLQDLQLCRAKVRPGGIIAGDDYTWNKREGYPVKRAVQAFAEANGLVGRLEISDNQYALRM